MTRSATNRLSVSDFAASLRLARALPLLLLAACGGDGGEGGGGGPTDSAPAWRAERVASLGSGGDAEGAHGGHGGGRANDSFGRITSVLADDSGTVYVADIEVQKIQVFDASGRHLRTIGRGGRGPGEFRYLVSTAWMGDTLAVLDPRNNRISLLSRDGRPLGTWPYQPLTGNPLTVRMHRASDREFWARGVKPAAGGGEQLDAFYVRFTSAGPSADTIPAPRAGTEGPLSVVCRIQQGLNVFEIPFRQPLLFSFAPDGSAAVVQGDEYRIAFVGPRGDTVRTVSRPYQPVPVTDEEWERATADFRGFRERVPGARCDPAEIPRPKAKAAIRWLMFAPSGELWVETVTRDGFAWDVFGADGKLLGSLPAPERSPLVPPYVRGDRLYVVRADSLDVQYVDVYRVTR